LFEVDVRVGKNDRESGPMKGGIPGIRKLLERESNIQRRFDCG
jgi:hypothetical protein